ncbi:hypothetical protein WICPIJ_004539 [Wickerhamomyces pijperi]|uniref:Uncharacterized protein n=1 Tax=Wickerhamomyces pijperi TaxID=599730 RepID=A0A9P8Q7T9_WICPI|nr:hypothetical protein WICPIJ_004539 [Wickerhamomyces pijperi]
MSAASHYDDGLDDELDDLDDYLDEFQDQILNNPPQVSTTTATSSSTAVKEPTTSNPATETNATLDGSDDEQIQKQLNEMMEAMDREQPGTASQFQSLLDEVAKMDQFTTAAINNSASTEKPSSPNGPSKDFKSTIADTLNRVKQSGGKVDQSIKDENNDPAKLVQDLFSQLNIEDTMGETGDLDLSSLLADMLDHLVQKDMLYEPLKDIDSKYPQWLIDNQPTITAEQFQKYHKQSIIIHEIVSKFEEESYRDDSKPHKEFISAKLEEMQEQGDPPKELAGELSKTGLPGFQFSSDDVNLDDFNPGELPEGFDKNLEESCKQQ